MKLRIQNNSIRLRLTKPEVDKIIAGVSVIAETKIGSNIFSYELIPNENLGFLASFENNKLQLFINQETAQTWQDETKVGFEETIEIEGNKLHILIEKDFKCLSPAREGKENEMFENPDVKC
jgi:hypothetical protein